MTKLLGKTSARRPKLSGEAAKKTIAEDEFGLELMVSALAETLTRGVTADGYVLGIEGEWGSGKSTFVNFISERISEEAPTHRIVRFDPWLLNEKNALLSLFFGQLAAKIDELKSLHPPSWRVDQWRMRRLTTALARNVRKYGEYVAILAKPVGALAATDPSGATALVAVGIKSAGYLAKLFGSGTPTLEKLKSNITSELLKIKKSRPDLRFTVIIDDTDRLEPGDAVEILRLVRKLADFPLTTYVVCFDRNVLAKQVERALGIADGHAFIEKIFQNIVSIPPQEPFALRRFLRKLFRESFPNEMSWAAPEDVEFEARKDALFDKWAGELLRTPRDVIRLHESVKLGWPHVSSEADFFDFAWLQLTKLKFQPLYVWTQRYLSNVGAYRDGGRAGDKEPQEQARELRELMAKYNWATRPYHSGIGYFLPGVNNFVLDGEKRKVFDFVSGELAKFERQRRLGSPSHWRRYFAFDKPSYAIGDDELADFRYSARHDVPKAANMLRNLAARPHDTPHHFVDVLLDRLSDTPDDSLSPEEISGIASALGEVMDEFIEAAGPRLSRIDDIWRKASGLVRKETATNFVNLLKVAPSVNWLARVVRQYVPRAGSGVPSDDQWLIGEDRKRAINAITGRFRELGVEKIFRKPEPLDILYCWLQLGDETEVVRFISNATQSDEMFLHVLGAMRTFVVSSDKGVYYPLRKTVVAHFMDADDAKKRLEHLAGPDTQKPDLREQAKALLFAFTDES